MKLPLIHLVIVSMETPLNCITHKVLPSSAFYSNLSRGLHFLECLSTSAGI